MDYLKTFLVALGVAVVITPLVIVLAKRYKVLDYPTGGRRIHNHPVPLLGGVAIYAAFWLAVLLTQSWERSFWGLWLGSTLILLVGVWDDIKGMRPLTKLLWQIGAAVILIFFGFSMDNISLPFIGSLDFSDYNLGWLGMAMAVFWVVGLVNTVNFSDGLDGLAAGICFVASLILFWSAHQIAQHFPAAQSAAHLTLAIAGASFGFLIFNFHPARIFMGDAGAMFLGYLIGGISITGLLKTATILGLIFPLIVMGMPLTDLTFAIVRRKLNGGSIAVADRGHLHHRLLDMGYTQRQAVLLLYGLSACFGFTAVLGAMRNWLGALLCLIVDFLLLTMIMMRKSGLFSVLSRRHSK